MDVNELIFHEVCRIKHNNKPYALFVGPNCCKYFYRIENDTYKEVTYEEYVDLMASYGSFTNALNKNSFKSLPEVIFNNKTMSIGLALLISLSLSSCTLSKDRIISNYKDMGIILDDGEFKNDNIYKITALKGGKYPYSEVITPKEFTKREHLVSITWDRIEEALNANEVFTAIQKEYFISAIENLKNSNLKINLGPLYHNIKNFKGFTNNKDETPDNLLAVASFNHYENTINLNGVKTEDYESTLIHEMFGHGLVHAYKKESETLCTVDYGYYTITEDGKIVGGGCLGSSMDEGFAETIRAIAMNETLSKENCAYQIESYVFNLLCIISNTKLDDFANNGIELLLHNLKEVGITKPQELIGYFDTIREALNKNELSGLNTDIANVLYEGVFKDLIDKYKKEGYSNEDIEKILDNYIESTSHIVLPEVYKNENMYIASTYDGVVTLNTTTLMSLYKEYLNSYTIK